MNWFGPIYQEIVPGDRVRRKRGRAIGEVVAVKEYEYGMTKTVFVDWGSSWLYPESHDTDCLIIVEPIPR